MIKNINISLKSLRNISRQRYKSQWAVDIMNRLQGKKKVKVRQIGDPILREIAKPVELSELVEPSFNETVDQLVSTMERFDSYGISAPQIGKSLQVIAIQVSGYHMKMAMKRFGSKGISKMQMTLCPLTVLINPNLKIIDPTQIVLRESCLSIQNFSALVPRAKEVKVEALNRDGQKVELSAVGWTARILQHEVDHLKGNLYVDSMTYKSLVNETWPEYKS